MTPATMTKAEPARAARPSSTKISVQFVYAPGLKRAVFRNVRLTGSWDREGRYSDDWSTTPMEEYTGEDGCPCYRAAVGLDESQVGWTFHWGVIVDGPAGKDKWGITTEVRDARSSDRSRAFALRPRDGDAVQQERYYLTHNRRLGAPEAPARGDDEGRHPLLGLGAQRPKGRGRLRHVLRRQRPQADPARRPAAGGLDRRRLHRRRRPGDAPRAGTVPDDPGG